MDWQPISLDELQTWIDRGLESSDAELQAFYAEIRVDPVKWQLHPRGDEGGGFWVVAKTTDLVVWFNDIEDGFNVSPFHTDGRIDEYWCNQDELGRALNRLRETLEFRRRSAGLSG